MLGPLLFVIFVNNLPEYIETNVVTPFADDTSVVAFAATYAERTKTLMSFVNWCKTNRLIVNLSKPQCFYFYCSNTARDLALDFFVGSRYFNELQVSAQNV